MNSLMENSELEEERRLCYVAITRAKENLWLVNAKRRTYFGMQNMNPTSRFINEIDDTLLEKDYVDEIIKIRTKTFIDENATYEIGDKISHDTFGVGVIVGIDKTILTIAFPHPIGIKKLLKGHKSINKL